MSAILLFRYGRKMYINKVKRTYLLINLNPKKDPGSFCLCLSRLKHLNNMLYMYIYNTGICNTDIYNCMV